MLKHVDKILMGAASATAQLFDRYFGPRFRWAEFSAAVASAYAAMKALGASLMLPEAPTNTLAFAAAIIAAIAYIRIPKHAQMDEKDENADGPDVQDRKE